MKCLEYHAGFERISRGHIGNYLGLDNIPGADNQDRVGLPGLPISYWL